MDDQPRIVTPVIVTPQEANEWPYGKRVTADDPTDRLVANLSFTVATEPERIRAAMAKAYAEGEAAAWNRHLTEWEHKPNPYVDAIENGADY